MKEIIDEWKRNRVLDEPISYRWDKSKSKIKKETIFYCVNRAKMRNKEKNSLEKDMRDIQSKIDRNVDREQNIGLLAIKKAEFNRRMESIARGARIRSKIENVENDEKSTKFFFSKESNRGEKKQIRALKKKDDILQNEKEIMEEVTTFYEKLYRSEGVDSEKIKENLTFIENTLDKNDREMLNAFITEEEIKKVLREMKNNKSPGEDGLSKEFYLEFENHLIEEMSELLNMIILEGKLPESQRNAIVTLLFKKNDHRELKNWRPVSLLNVDYKILSKILTNRLRKIIHKLVPESQKCGTPGRNMSDILIVIDSICEYMDNNEHEGGALICMDLEKAFDRVNHKYLFKVLAKMGINGNFLTLVKSMYNDITSQVEINGKLTKKISITRSVRQGCSLSMLLFVLSAVPFIKAIEKDKEIKGLRTKYGQEIKILAYADDTSIYIRDMKCLKRIEHIFDQYAAASEAKLNKEKTEILPLGRWKDDLPYKEKYKNLVKHEVKILGAIFTQNRKNFSKLNWDSKMEKIDKIIDFHRDRNISLLGKILLINSLIFSQIWHIGGIITPTKTGISKLYRKLNSWLNGTRGHNIIDQIMKPKEYGGAGLLNLEQRLTAIKIKNLQFLITGDWYKDFDIILYWAGTKNLILSGKMKTGPKCETCTNKYGDIISTMVKNRNKLCKIANMKVRDIEKNIYPMAKTDIPYKNIYSGISTKMISLNFKIATNILKTAVNRDDADRACGLCKSRMETIHHLFLECEKLKLLRTYVKRYTQIATGKLKELDWNYVINMQNIEVKIEYEILSVYK